MTLFPDQKSDVFYITEGGTETEIIYKLAMSCLILLCIHY
jgi:hypothetical protein